MPERQFCIDNLMVRIHIIIVMIRWTGLAPWEFEFPFPGSLTSTFQAEIVEHVPTPPPRGASAWRVRVFAPGGLWISGTSQNRLSSHTQVYS